MACSSQHDNTQRPKTAHCRIKNRDVTPADCVGCEICWHNPFGLRKR